ncbi:hypothetical protein HQ447_00405 [bacterium]|nr:hypothetical protein [bacterium]
MKKHTCFLLLSAAFGLLSANAAVDCIALSASVKNAVAADKSRVLEVVSKEVSAAPGCACEIVKAAIVGSAADAKTVASIVESAAIAAPDQIRLISQCAVAVAPDARNAVQIVIARLDPKLAASGTGTTGANSPLGEAANSPSPLGEDATGADSPFGGVNAAENPLNFPGAGPVGPTPGGPGGMSSFSTIAGLNGVPPGNSTNPPLVSQPNP